jgi:SHS2 domain-containing protein
MSPAGYEYSGTGGDLALTAWGEDLPECLRQCALGIFNLIVPTASVRPLEGREVAARGASPEALVVNWLDECLYVHDLEGFVVADVARPELRGGSVHAVLRGEAADPARHPPGKLVKAAARDGLEVREEAERVTARVTLHI